MSYNTDDRLTKEAASVLATLLVSALIIGAGMGIYHYGRLSGKTDELIRAAKELNATLGSLSGMLPYLAGGGGLGAVIGYSLGPEERKGLSTLVGTLAGGGLGAMIAPKGLTTNLDKLTQELSKV